MVTKIKKRNGFVVDFEKGKIFNAVLKALTATGQDKEKAETITEKVIDLLNIRYKKDEIPTVEEIQDIIEEVFILKDLVKTAKAFILYREQRRRIRVEVTGFDEAIDLIDKYLGSKSWDVKENANMTYSLQGLNQFIIARVAKKYWLNKVYPKEIRDSVENVDLHIHDLEAIGSYCCGWDLQDLLLRGFGGVSGKINSKPAKHFRTALGQLVNFFYTLQGESAGAQAVSNFDTLLAPFIRYDNLSYAQVKQAMQEFVFNCMVPTRVGFQTPFINVSLDIKVPKHMKDEPVIIGGKLKDKTYGDFQDEVDIFIRAFYEVLMDGDSDGRPFTFPIPTISITSDFNWNNKALDPMWEATAKYGINYFSNFVNSDMNPEDFRTMCCRLRLDNTELKKRGGGLFGSAPLTGSIGVVTINMPRIGYLSKTKKEYFKRLEHLMDLASESLEIKRKTIETFMEKGLYPYSKHYLTSIKKIRGSYFGNHFSTIGLLGMNESLLNFMREDIASKNGKKFSEDVLDFMNNKLLEYQKKSGNLYNLEATPGEGTTARFARADKKKYPDIITAGTEQNPYYSNSTQLPVNYTDDIFKALELQDSLQTKYTGGCVHHLFLGEKISTPETAKNLVKKIFENFRLPYITLTPTFSICPNHGYISGEHFQCPKCVIEQPCEVYSRVVGYLRPVQQWNDSKKEEFKDRKEYNCPKLLETCEN